MQKKLSMKKKHKIAILITLVILLLSTIGILWFTNPFVPYATSEDIETTISPEKINVKDYNQTISLKVEMKNIAKSDRKIMDFVYTTPTESIDCYIVTNNTTYIYSTRHVDIGYRPIQPDKVLKPGEIFTFQIEIPLSLVANFTLKKHLYEDNSNSADFYIILRIYGTFDISNKIEIIKS